jgi:deazaflavin-dependent oxidoreductase (nitroreductase family)
MAHIEGEVLIRRPVEEVFDFVADERTEPTYNRNMVAAEKLTEGPIGVGTRFRATIRAGRRPLPMDVEYTDFTRPHLIASTTRTAVADFRGTLTFTPTSSGTRLRWSWQSRPKGAVRLAAPLLSRLGARQERAMWTRLRDHLEAGGASSAAGTRTGAATRPPRMPPPWFVHTAWRVHRALYRLSGGRFLWTPANKRGWGALRLTTVGRKSGRERSVIIGYLEDGSDLVTLAMNGWDEGHPAWWLNLQAHPDAVVRLAGQEPRPVRARITAGDERARLWQRWAAVDQGLDGYAARRSTETPVVVLEPRDGKG